MTFSKGTIEEDTFRDLFDIMASEEIYPSDEYLCDEYLILEEIH